MSVVEQGGSNLVTRVQNILMKPKAEWDVIAAETATTQGLFTGYACILAAIPAIAGLIGRLLPVCVLGVCVHTNIVFVAVAAVVQYVLSLVGVYVIGLIINALAPSFDGVQNPIQAMKVAVYSFTAAWLAGIFSIFLPLAILGLLGLYSFYLLYVGLPRLMKSPQEKSLGYTAVSVICGIVVYVIIGAVAGVVLAMGAVGTMGATTFGAASPASISVSGPGGSVSVNGPGGSVSVNGPGGAVNIDMGKLKAAAGAVQAMQNGKVQPGIDPEKLKALLPSNVAGLPRTEISADSIGGTGTSKVEAVYQQGDRRLTLSVTDLAGASAFAGMASALNVQSSHETASGYDKTSMVGGRMTHEEWDNRSHNGQYSVMVASRFVVQADGTADSIDTLKSAVAAVGPDRLEGLSHS
jgi:hypothetical protein